MNRVETPISFAGWRVPVGFMSDGCTLAPDSVLAIRLRPIEIYRLDLREACYLHDFNRRHRVHYGIMTPSEADHLFRVHLRALGATSFMAGVYYAAVKVLRPATRRTQPLPYSGWHSVLRREPLAV